MKYKVSVIINAYNEAKDLSECIRSVKAQSMKPFEIIVVDNGSKDNTAMIAKNDGAVVYTIVPRSRGLARDYGWRKAKGNIVAYLDADMIVNKDWIKEIVKKFGEGADGVIDRIKVWKPNNIFTQVQDSFYSFRFENNYVPFLAWAFKKELLKKVGGFKDTWLEDGELGARFLKAGYRIILADKAIRYHKGPPRTYKDMLNRSYFFGVNGSKSIYKNHPEMLPKKSILFYILFIASEIASILGAVINPLTLLWIPLSLLLLYLLLLLKLLFINGAFGKMSLKTCICLTVASWTRALIWPAGVIKGYYFS